MRANNTETALNPSFTLYSGALVLAVKEITVIKTMWPYTPQSIRPLSPCLTDLSHSLPCQLVNYLFTKDRNRWPMFVLMFFSYQPYTKPNTTLQYVHRDSNHQPTIKKHTSRNQQTPFAPLIRQSLIWPSRTSVLESTWRERLSIDPRIWTDHDKLEKEQTWVKLGLNLG